MGRPFLFVRPWPAIFCIPVNSINLPLVVDGADVGVDRGVVGMGGGMFAFTSSCRPHADQINGNTSV